MSGDSLRACAPVSAPTEGTTVSSPVFAFRGTHSPMPSEVFRSTAHVGAVGLNFFYVSAEEGGALYLSRHSGDLSSILKMTPEQARAVGAELIAAADVIEPQAGSASSAADALALLGELVRNYAPRGESAQLNPYLGVDTDARIRALWERARALVSGAALAPAEDGTRFAPGA